MDMVQHMIAKDMVHHKGSKNMLHNRVQKMCSIDIVLAVVSLKSMVTDEWCCSTYGWNLRRLISQCTFPSDALQNMQPTEATQFFYFSSSFLPCVNVSFHLQCVSCPECIIESGLPVWATKPAFCCLLLLSVLPPAGPRFTFTLAISGHTHFHPKPKPSCWWAVKACNVSAAGITGNTGALLFSSLALA